MSLDELHAWWIAQPKCCALCADTEALCIDHCHLSGRVRALLCRRCNNLVGIIEKRPDLDWHLVVDKVARLIGSVEKHRVA